MNTTSRFRTLLQREWMQHRRGWIVIATLPFVVVVLAGLFGHLQMDIGDGEVLQTDGPGPLVATIATLAAVGGLTLTLAWTATLLQSPGLARRDVQDRSIEFWLSLPTSHAQSIGATLLAHLLLWPWAALLAGLAGGLLASLLVVGKVFGVGAWLALPWGSLLPVLAAFVLRLVLGLLLATLWLSPLIVGTMAASAWLKRWGMPAVVGLLGIGGLLLDKLYGNPVVWTALRVMSDQASRALLATERGAQGPFFELRSPADLPAVLLRLPRLLIGDAGDALAALATPQFALALAGGAAAFGALWLRRQRGA